jgi:hypothetical protein
VCLLALFGVVHYFRPALSTNYAEFIIEFTEDSSWWSLYIGVDCPLFSTLFRSEFQSSKKSPTKTSFTQFKKLKSNQSQLKMSSRTVYIPNLTGGQAIQINEDESEYTIRASSFSSSGLKLERRMKNSAPVNFHRPGSPSSNPSSPSTYIPDDAF